MLRETLLLLLFWQTSSVTSLAPIRDSLANGRPQEALRQLQSMPPEQQRSGPWHMLASRAYDALDQPKLAVEQAEAALAVNPRDEAYHLQLGQIFLTRNTPRAAKEIFQDALKLFPDSLPLLLGRGIAEMNLGEYETAEQDLALCLQRQPNLGIAFESLETVYFQTSRPEEAEAAALRYRERNPSDYRGYYFFALAEDRLQREDRQPELRGVEETLRRNPAYTPAKVLLAKIWARQGETQKALSLLEQAVRERPDHAPAHLELAALYRKLGRREDAEREQKILQSLADRRPPALVYHRGSAAAQK